MAAGYSLFSLRATPEELASARLVLDATEQARARAFRFDRDRRRFIVRRNRLRQMLADHLGCAPAEIRYDANAFGKPMVAGRPGFSLSHSRDHALVAIDPEGDVGCDIEWRDPTLASPEIARRFFAPAEIAALKALPAPLWLDAFFACWSRKEAYVKALGLGLSYPLDAFDVEVDPRAPASFGRALPGWHLHAFEPLPGLHAAIVTQSAAVPRDLSESVRAIAA